MRKLFYAFVMSVLTASSFVSCKEDEKEKTDPDHPTYTEGVFILTQGNYYNKIEGGLNYLDYSTGVLSERVFRSVNGRNLGDTPQCGIVYGSKIYLGVEFSNTIEIIDLMTFKSIKQISLASQPGQQPRSMVAKDGKVYISMFTGYVSRLDTLSMTIDANVKVGPNPDCIAIHGNNILVPNSDGMSWNTTGYGKTASVVDIAGFKEVKTFEVPLNPETFYSNGKDLFLLSKGNYEDIESAIYRVDPASYTYEKLAPATMAAITDDTLYVINAPNASSKTFKKYNLSTKTFSDMLQDSSDIIFPSGIAVDKFSGKILIASMYLSQWGYGDNDAPSFLMVYDINGKTLNKFDLTPGPADIFFRSK